MTHEQATAIHRAARQIVWHIRKGDLHPVDFQRFKEAMFGDPLYRIDTADLIRVAHVCAGMEQL